MLKFKIGMNPVKKLQ